MPLPVSPLPTCPRGSLPLVVQVSPLRSPPCCLATTSLKPTPATRSWSPFPALFFSPGFTTSLCFVLFVLMVHLVPPTAVAAPSGQGLLCPHHSLVGWGPALGRVHAGRAPSHPGWAGEVPGPAVSGDTSHTLKHGTSKDRQYLPSVPRGPWPESPPGSYRLLTPHGAVGSGK